MENQKSPTSDATESPRRLSIKPDFKVARGLEESERRLQQFEASQKRAKNSKVLSHLHACAPRYAKESLSTFVPTNAAMSTVLKRMERIAERIREFVDGGYQLCLWGDIGTGKDHLAVSLLRVAALAGYSVTWREGLSIYEEVAGAYRSESTQASVYDRYVRPKVLCISDPVFTNNWSQAKEEALRKLVRKRYDLGRATWTTCNFLEIDTDEDHGPDAMMGADTWDRLRQKGVLVHCSWPSFRTQEQQEF